MAANEDNLASPCLRTCRNGYGLGSEFTVDGASLPSARSRAAGGLRGAVREWIGAGRGLCARAGGVPGGIPHRDEARQGCEELGERRSLRGGVRGGPQGRQGRLYLRPWAMGRGALRGRVGSRPPPRLWRL